MKILLLVLAFIYHGTACAQDTLIHKDPRIDSLIKKQIQINELTTRDSRRNIPGYRIQVAKSNDRNQVFAIKTKTATGVVGLIKGKNPGNRVIALRADMDARPIKEENSVSYKSQNEGVMHACGHDAHTSILLGASKILQELKSEWEGTVKLIFQPGEERNPGGASLLIKEGELHDPQHRAIFGLHVHPGWEFGKFV